MEKKRKGEKVKKVRGRKPLPMDEKRERYYIYLNPKELKILNEQLDSSHHNRLSEFVRYKLLKNHNQVFTVNPVELLKTFDSYGTEMARIGNNVNQLAKFANQLNINNQVDPKVVSQLSERLVEYNALRTEIVKYFKRVMTLS